MPSRILLVEDDPDVAIMVADVLTSPDCSVRVARDGAEGLTRAVEWRPDLVITDVMMPGLDGWAFVRALRARSDFALVPVIFLTALSGEADRVRGFRLGADDYLPKPFSLDELRLRVGRALRWRREAVDNDALVAFAAGPIAGLQGSLSDLGLATLLSMVGMEGRSGVLLLRRRRATGSIFLRNGRVIAARLDGDGEVTAGAEVVYRLLGWSDGSFDFSQRDPGVDDEIDMSTTHLLLEGARRLDHSHGD